MSIATEIQRLQTAKENITIALLRAGYDIPSGITLDEYPPYIDPYFFEELTFNIISAGTIYWKADNASYTKTIEYNKNNNGWTSITSTTGGTQISVNSRDKLQFRGNNAVYGNGNYYNTFSGSTAKFEVEGNIMSLINSTGFTTATTLTNSYIFYRLFSNCTGLTSAEHLILPATTLASYCYGQMFWGCTSLTTAPELPATTLADYCYASTFSGCRSLTTAPVLPATTLAGSCYARMFSGCTNLNYIKCLATDKSASHCTDSWVEGVASTGTFVKNPNMTGWTTGNNGIPSGWTVENLPVEIYCDDFPEEMMIREAGSVEEWLDNYNSANWPGVNLFELEDVNFIFYGKRYYLYKYEESGQIYYGLLSEERSRLPVLQQNSISQDVDNYLNNYYAFDYVLNSDMGMTEYGGLSSEPEHFIVVWAE